MSAAAADPMPHSDLTDGLFPPAVLAVCRPIDEDALGHLLPEERALVSSAVPKRQREFATGRRTARELVASLGVAAGPLLRGADRAPAWPAGVVGSISHCDDVCAVAVARAADVAGVGVDVEPDLPLERALWSRLCTPGELAALAGAGPPDEPGRTVRLLFSAKEAFYKSVSATVRRVLGFQEVELQFDWAAGRFTARIDGSLARLLPGGRAPDGRFARRGGFVLTGATLAAR